MLIKKNELIFQLSYKQNISNQIDKQNIHELVSQFNYKQIRVEWESGSGIVLKKKKYIYIYIIENLDI